MPEDMQEVSLEELSQEFTRVLKKIGFPEQKAVLCARIFTENTRDGVLSHGINRFPAFVDFVRRGIVDINADPILVYSSGALERWDGQRGPGPLNATFCMNRAIQLAGEQSLGCVALRNTSHWMRAGTYGLQAADAGCIGICWTNTTALMPPWGGSEPKLGNNPIVICVPATPDHVLLDMSMSQFSMGRLQIAQQSGAKLPVPGGFDRNGALTDDAATILESGSPLPIGYWKGSGMALLLDCVVSLLADGNATHQISREKDEASVSQLFIAIDLTRAGANPQVVRGIIDDLHSSKPAAGMNGVSFPGENTAARRKSNITSGVRIDSATWRVLKAL